VPGFPGSGRPTFRFAQEQAQTQELLKAIDALIDLGDRRGAALEQAESFRGVQASMQPKHYRAR